MKNSTQIKSSTIYKYTVPIFLVFCFAIIIPLIICIIISLTNWRGGPKIDFIGLQNYQTLLNDKTFWLSFLHNIEFIGLLIVMQIFTAFLLAIFLQSKFIYFKEFHRRVIFLPTVLAAMVVGMIWQLVYRNDIGLISSLIRAFGFNDVFIGWLSNPNMVIFSICLTLTWQYTGQFLVIITAGMQNVDKNLLDAAAIDGANSMQRAIYIILPLLKSTFSVMLLICISGSMKLFDIIFIMTAGGPGNASMVTALYSYNLAFKVQKLGYASTAAIGMIILSLILVLISRRFIGGKDNG